MNSSTAFALTLVIALSVAGSVRAADDACDRTPFAEWPARLENGRPILMAKAAAGDEKARKGQECEARFYMAARLLAGGGRTEALPLLEKVADECPRHYIEYDSALVELKRVR